MLTVPTPPCPTCGSILVRATQDTCLNCSSVAMPVRLAYTNHAGLRQIRTFVPRLVFYGSTPWHPNPQWILRAWDVDKQAERDFALAGFAEPGGRVVPSSERRARALLGLATVPGLGVIPGYAEVSPLRDDAAEGAPDLGTDIEWWVDGVHALVHVPVTGRCTYSWGASDGREMEGDLPAPPGGAP